LWAGAEVEAAGIRLVLCAVLMLLQEFATVFLVSRKAIADFAFELIWV